MKKTETLWAIMGRWSNSRDPFLFRGTFRTRRDAIADHCHQLGRTWKQRRRAGDRAVRVTISYEVPTR